VKKSTAAISINFAGTDYRLITRVRAVLIVLLAVLLCTAGGLIMLTRTYGAKRAAVEKGIQELLTSQQKLQSVVAERQRIVQNLTTMSALLEAKGFSWTRFLSALEEVFPSGVALARLEFNPRERNVVLEGKAASPEALSGLMIRLERSPSFKNPLLKRQSMEKGIRSFHVGVIYQEPPAAGAPSGAAQRKDQ
jgi:Tfp pilus assembly protein PilN